MKNIHLDITQVRDRKENNMNKKLPDWFGKKRIYNSYFKNNENEIIKWEVLTIKNKQKIKVRFISTNSDNRQGIRLAIDAGKGTLTTNGVTGRGFELWEDECPKEFELECTSDEGYLSVYNIFEKYTQGTMMRRSYMDYSGMILEQNGNIYRYKCNNATLKDDFDKLIFEIELL